MKANCSVIKILLAFIWLFSITIYAQPKIEVKEGTELELGEVNEGTVINKKLTLFNRGTDTLIIDDIRASCGCTTVKTGKRKLSANESTEYFLTIKTDKFKGRLKKQVFITSNDSLHQELEIVFYLTVRNIIEFEPAFVNFRTLRIGNVSKQVIKVHNTSKKPLTIISLSSPDDQITLSLSKKMIESKGTTDLTATVIATKKGQILGRFEIKTNNREKSTLKLSFIGHIK